MRDCSFDCLPVFRRVCVAKWEGVRVGRNPRAGCREHFVPYALRYRHFCLPAPCGPVP